MKTKLKLPELFPSSRKKLRATTTRRPLRIATATNYEEMDEPNMKLSRALLIVLLLHVIAVTGIIAFNAIKTRPSSIAHAMINANPAKTNTGSKPLSLSSLPASTPKEAASHDETKSPRSASKPVAKDTKTPPGSGKTYVVAKGDKPVMIAKKFKVSYDDLLALNHIDDPRKLKIGQKLLIPNKPTKAKKPDE